MTAVNSNLQKEAVSPLEAGIIIAAKSILAEAFKDFGLKYGLGHIDPRTAIDLYKGNTEAVQKRLAESFYPGRWLGGRLVGAGMRSALKGQPDISKKLSWPIGAATFPGIFEALKLGHSLGNLTKARFPDYEQAAEALRTANVDIGRLDSEKIKEIVKGKLQSRYPESRKNIEDFLDETADSFKDKNYALKGVFENIPSKQTQGTKLEDIAVSGLTNVSRPVTSVKNLGKYIKNKALALRK